MDKKKFESMLILIVPEVVKLIVENSTFGEIEASEKFYESLSTWQITAKLVAKLLVDNKLDFKAK